MHCAKCRSERFTKAGFNQQGRQIVRCTGCGRRQTERSSSPFGGSRFPNDIIAPAVRWYLRFRLSYVDIVELLAERGISVDPSTMFDWVQRSSNLLPHSMTHLLRRGPRSRSSTRGIPSSGAGSCCARSALPCMALPTSAWSTAST